MRWTRCCSAAFCDRNEEGCFRYFQASISSSERTATEW